MYWDRVGAVINQTKPKGFSPWREMLREMEKSSTRTKIL